MDVVAGLVGYALCRATPLPTAPPREWGGDAVSRLGATFQSGPDEGHDVLSAPDPLPERTFAVLLSLVCLLKHLTQLDQLAKTSIALDKMTIDMVSQV